jgi:hypothetical protein
MLAVRSPITSLGQCGLGIRRICIKLIGAACDSYRPERHYIRGSGSKWFAKHDVVPVGLYVKARQVRDHCPLTSEQQPLLSAPPGQAASLSRLDVSSI